MERKGAQVFGLLAVGAQHNVLCLAFGGHNAEKVLEKLFHADAGVVEMLLSECQGVNAVERIGLNHAVLGVVAYHIPPLLENAQEVGLYDDAFACFAAVEWSVGELNLAKLLDGVDHSGEIAACRRHVFQHHAVGDVACVAEHSVDRH